MRMVSRSASADAPQVTRPAASSCPCASARAVYLSVPFCDRATMAEQLLRDGFAVLVEGPLTADPATANRVRDLSILNAAAVMETAPFRYQEQHRVAVDLARAGAIGRVREVRAQVSATLLATDEDDIQPGWHDAVEAGTAVIGAVRSLLDSEPTGAVGWCEEDEDGAEHSFSGVFRFAGDAMASVAWSVRTGYGAGYTVVGDAGTIDVPKAFLPAATRFGNEREVVVTDRDGRRSVRLMEAVDADDMMLDAFADLLEHPGVHPGDMDDIVANTMAMDALRSAARRPAPRQRGRQWNLSRSA